MSRINSERSARRTCGDPMHSLQPKQPFPIRAINAVGRAAARLGRRLPSLDEEALLHAARAEARLDDYGPVGFREGLHVLLQSLETEARLTTLGRISARGQILALLTNRLRLVDHRKRHPELADEEIRRPLFVLGLPRTGTTILYGLLARDPAHRSPLTWEVAFPCPPPETATYTSDPRIARADEQFDQLKKLAPGFDAIHPMAAQLPQECVAIFAHEFKSVQFEAAFDVPSYQEWLEAQDMRPVYRFHREFLQHLQSRCPGDRWVLKTPGHLPSIDTLLTEYPDAMIVQTHRDPLEVIGSVSSLECILRGAGSDAIDPLAIGRQQVALWSRQIAMGMNARRATGRSDCFHDVHFRELLADPIACVKRIYAHFELPLGAEAEARMRAFLDDNARDKHGVHRYALADFGIDPREAARHFDAYYETFGIPRSEPGAL
jgi:hypothetical protein